MGEEEAAQAAMARGREGLRLLRPEQSTMFAVGSALAASYRECNTASTVGEP